MRAALSFGFLITLLVAVPPALQAQDVTGTWELTSTTPRGERTLTVTLAQEGTAVTGTAQMAMMGRRGGAAGAGRRSPREVPISDGTFQEGTLTFTITMGIGERTFSQTYVATTVTDTTMEGSITGQLRSNEPLPFKGVKKES